MESYWFVLTIDIIITLLLYRIVLRGLFFARLWSLRWTRLLMISHGFSILATSESRAPSSGDGCQSLGRWPSRATIRDSWNSKFSNWVETEERILVVPDIPWPISHSKCWLYLLYLWDASGWTMEWQLKVSRDDTSSPLTMTQSSVQAALHRGLVHKLLSNRNLLDHLQPPWSACTPRIHPRHLQTRVSKNCGEQPATTHSNVSPFLRMASFRFYWVSSSSSGWYIVTIVTEGQRRESGWTDECKMVCLDWPTRAVCWH